MDGIVCRGKQRAVLVNGYFLMIIFSHVFIGLKALKNTRANNIVKTKAD